jgi:hypothetical protein
MPLEEEFSLDIRTDFIRKVTIIVLIQVAVTFVLAILPLVW